MHHRKYREVLLLRKATWKREQYYIVKDKGKVVPLQARMGPEGSRKLSFPDFVTTAQDGVGCQPYAPAAFTPKKYSWNSFLLEAESTPAP